MRENVGSTDAARSTNSFTASFRRRTSRLPLGSGSSRGGMGSSCSPERPSGARLVARARTRGAVRRMVATASAPGRTCSKLSRSRSMVRSRRLSARISSTGRPLLSCRNLSADPMVSGTSWGSVTEDRSTKNTPSGNRPMRRLAACTANRVLPVPPGPVSVTRRLRSTSSVTRPTSRSRPTNDVNSAGRLVGISRVLIGGKSDGRPSITSSWRCSGWPGLSGGAPPGLGGTRPREDRALSATWWWPREEPARRVLRRQCGRPD